MWWPCRAYWDIKVQTENGVQKLKSYSTDLCHHNWPRGIHTLSKL